MAILISKIDKALRNVLHPKHIYIGKYGHTPELANHFHFIPASQWLIDLFWQDARYRVLSDFADNSLATSTDGAELTFFIWREFCERKDPPAYRGISKAEIITLLRSHLSFT